MTALSWLLRLPLKKLLGYALGLFLLVLIGCFTIDRAVSFYVQDRVYEDLETLPHRHYALVLGTSKYVTKGKTNNIMITAWKHQNSWSSKIKSIICC